MNQVTGKIIKVGKAHYFTTKSGEEGWSQKIILDCGRTVDGRVLPNYVQLEYSERLDEVSKAEVKLGNKVTCCFDVAGFLREDDDEGMWVTQRLKCFKILSAGASPVEAAE